MSKLKYKGKPLLFKCNRKRCGDKCDEICEWTTDIEYAEQAEDGEYDVCPGTNPEKPEQEASWYMAVPIRENKKR